MPSVTRATSLEGHETVEREDALLAHGIEQRPQRDTDEQADQRLGYPKLVGDVAGEQAEREHDRAGRQKQ